MRLIQLQYFVEIVRQQSFTRAAEKLYVSQPALSKSVRMLEQEFKVANQPHGKELCPDEKWPIVF